jgi:glycosyltransferase involved in cell wall biosynthesis
MPRTPLVSIIIPFFDAERFLEEAIRSVVAQSYSEWELLLIDDGSSDGSTEIARRCAREWPERVQVLEHDGHRNRGLAASRNLGLRHARGEYVALLDADDVWLPEKLERQVALLRPLPDVAMIYGRSQYWHSWQSPLAGHAADEVPDLGVHIPLDTVILPPMLLVLNYPLGLSTAPPPSNLLFRKIALERLGGFEEQFGGIHQMYEDQAVLTKCYLTERVFVSSECWDRYRQHPRSLGAVGTRDGHYPAVRGFFLEWCRSYLHAHAVAHSDVWQALHLALWPHLPETERNEVETVLRRSLGRPASRPVTMTVEGAHDVATCDAIGGWVWDPHRPSQTMAVDVYDGETLVLTLAANRFRRDLLAAGKGDGYHAFTCRLPPWLCDGTTHRIWVKVAGTGVALSSTPRMITCAPR